MYIGFICILNNYIEISHEIWKDDRSRLYFFSPSRLSVLISAQRSNLIIFVFIIIVSTLLYIFLFSNHKK